MSKMNYFLLSHFFIRFGKNRLLNKWLNRFSPRFRALREKMNFITVLKIQNFKHGINSLTRRTRRRGEVQ